VHDAQVLNLADNQVSGMVKLRGVPKLRALILTNNAITGIRGVPSVMTAQASIDDPHGQRQPILITAA
jgi:hypothetical protein